MPKVARSAMNMYKLIDKDWGGAKLSPPTGLDAINACRVLWNDEVGGWPFNGVKIVSGNRHTWGNRYTWSRYGELAVNPNRYGKGWSEIVHDLSHLAHDEKNRKNGRRPKPHSFDHAKIERRMQRLVLDRLI